MRILVTGGAGFIGSYLCERLIRDGHNVTALDSITTGNIVNLDSVINHPNFVFVQGSILETSILDPLIDEAEYVFHLAAAVGVFNIVQKPLESLLINIRGTENVLSRASLSMTPVFLTSSSEVYGKNTASSLKESDDRILGSPTTLRWSYSEAKAIDESLAFAYHVEKKLETRIVRFFNTVGPRQVGAYGMVVPRFIESAIQNLPINIFGTGQQTRCFIHVLDVIEALMLIAFSNKTIGKVINIGNNFEISIKDLALKIIKDTNSNSEIFFVPYVKAYGPGFEDMERRVPNIDLIKELVSWQPTRDLTQIISDIALEIRAKI